MKKEKDKEDIKDAVSNLFLRTLIPTAMRVMSSCTLSHAGSSIIVR